MLQACCCFTLRTGSIITGVLSLIFSIIFLLVGIYDVAVVSEAQREIQIEINLVWVTVIVMLLSLINVVVSSLLLYGSIKEKKWTLMPWLIYNAFSLGLLNLVIIALVFLFSWKVLFFLILISPGWFFWAVVLGYYWEIRRREDGGNSYQMNKPHQGAATISYPNNPAYPPQQPPYNSNV